MKLSSTLLSAAFVLVLGACAESGEAVKSAGDAAVKTAADAKAAVTTTDVDYKGAPSGVYNLEKTHAYITFSYLHQGYSKPFLRWRNWDSTLNWDNENPANSSVSVKINTNSIDTGVDIFDEHMRDENWLNVAAHPEAVFTSTSLKKVSGNTGKMMGDLTLKGITKPVTLDVTFNKAGEGRQPGTHKIGFSARGQVMRSDWDLGAYVPFVSDEVDLIIEVEYIRKAEAE